MKLYQYRNSSVATLLALLAMKRRIPNGENWPAFEESLRDMASLTANRIIYHAQFALDFLQSPVFSAPRNWAELRKAENANRQ